MLRFCGRISEREEVMRKNFVLEMLESWKGTLLGAANTKTGFEGLIRSRYFNVCEKREMRENLRTCRAIVQEAIEAICKYRAELSRLGVREN